MCGQFLLAVNIDDGSMVDSQNCVFQEWDYYTPSGEFRVDSEV